MKRKTTNDPGCKNADDGAALFSVLPRLEQVLLYLLAPAAAAARMQGVWVMGLVPFVYVLLVLTRPLRVPATAPPPMLHGAPVTGEDVALWLRQQSVGLVHANNEE